MKFYLETERLILREMLPSDAKGMFELDSNPIVHKYLGNKPIKTKQQAVDVIQFIREQYNERGIGRFATIEKSTGDFIGWSGLKLNIDKKEELNGKRNFYDIGYRFIPRFWGKGYTTESALAVLDYGFKELNIKTIFGAAEVDNIASNKVLQRIGLRFINEFPFEDEMTNWYELTKIDHNKNKSRARSREYYHKNKAKVAAYKNARYKNDEVFREKLKAYYKLKYREDENYKNKTLENAKNRYYEDEDYKKRTIERAKKRYKKNKKS